MAARGASAARPLDPDTVAVERIGLDGRRLCICRLRGSGRVRYVPASFERPGAVVLSDRSASSGRE